MNISPDKIRQARESAGLTQKQAAEMVHSHPVTWAKWEGGVYPIDPARWELFLLKTRGENGSSNADR